MLSVVGTTNSRRRRRRESSRAGIAAAPDGDGDCHPYSFLGLQSSGVGGRATLSPPRAWVGSASAYRPAESVERRRKLPGPDLDRRLKRTRCAAERRHRCCSCRHQVTHRAQSLVSTSVWSKRDPLGRFPPRLSGSRCGGRRASHGDGWRHSAAFDRRFQGVKFLAMICCMRSGVHSR